VYEEVKMIYINHKKMNAHIIFFDKQLKYHRLNGPAIVDEGYEAWYKNGELHRLDGPAVIDGDKRYWYIEEVKYTESEYYDKLKEMGLE
jgi:hypothetical protein